MESRPEVALRAEAAMELPLPHRGAKPPIEAGKSDLTGRYTIAPARASSPRAPARHFASGQVHRLLTKIVRSNELRILLRLRCVALLKSQSTCGLIVHKQEGLRGS
jgi:hypothetical protein